MAGTSKRKLPSRESADDTLLQSLRQRPALAALLLTGVLAVLALVVAMIWYISGGVGKSGPNAIQGSPWDHRNAPGGPKTPNKAGGLSTPKAGGR